MVSAHSSSLCIVSAECHIRSHEIPGGAGHPAGLDGEISLVGGVNYPRLRGCRGFAEMRGAVNHRISSVPQQLQLHSGERGGLWDISRVFIKTEIMNLIKSASPLLLLPNDAPRKNSQGFLLLADISCDHVMKLLFKLQICF